MQGQSVRQAEEPAEYDPVYDTFSLQTLQSWEQLRAGCDCWRCHAKASVVDSAAGIAGLLHCGQYGDMIDLVDVSCAISKRQQGQQQ